MLKSLKIGLTGSTGVLGRLSINQLKNQGHETYPYVGDIRDSVKLTSWLEERPLDAIFHYAAVVPTKQVMEDPLHAYTVNTGGTLHLLEALRDCPYRPWFFYASTCHVYQSKESPISEDDPVAPVSRYGWTKYLAERICLDVAESMELPVCAGRIFSFYHETQKKPFLFPTMLERLENEDLDKPFFIYGAEGQRDFLNAEDVCLRIHGLMQARATGIYNIGSGIATTIRDFVQKMAPRKLTIVTNDERSNLIANVGKLHSELRRINYAID